MASAQFGLALPERTALVLVRLVAAAVVTAGAAGVVNDMMAPRLVDTLLVAIAQK